MRDPIPDSTVFISLALSIIIVFFLIFSTKPKASRIETDMQWKDNQIQGNELIEANSNKENIQASTIG